YQEKRVYLGWRAEILLNSWRSGCSSGIGVTLPVEPRFSLSEIIPGFRAAGKVCREMRETLKRPANLRRCRFWLVGAGQRRSILTRSRSPVMNRAPKSVDRKIVKG